METNESRLTGQSGGNVPARRTTRDLDTLHRAYLPDDVRKLDDELLAKSYLIRRTLDAERQLARRINHETRGLSFDVIDSYAGFAGDTVDLKDSIQNEETKELVIGLAQGVLRDSEVRYMRNLKIFEGKISRVAETDLSFGLNARLAKEEPTKPRKLTWGERFRGEADL